MQPGPDGAGRRVQRENLKRHEVARLDHSFERGLSHVTADYSMRKDGGLRVLNRGYSEKKKEWKTAEGKAYFVKGTDEGYLKVSFFGPFYGSYVIFQLDEENYQFAIISGPNKSYLWILARTPELNPELKQNLISRAADVTLKEGRPLVLVFRETPLHRGHIRLMDLAAEAGAVIFPPAPAFYARPQSIDEMVSQIAGRVLARLGIENEGYAQWRG